MYAVAILVEIPMLLIPLQLPNARFEAPPKNSRTLDFWDLSLPYTPTSFNLENNYVSSFSSSVSEIIDSLRMLECLKFV